MIRAFGLIIFAWIAPMLTNAQVDKLDSLRNVLTKLSQRDTAYVMTLCHIAAAEGFVDPSNALLHARECLERAEALKHDAGVIFALNLLAIESQRRGNYPEALKLYFRAVDLAEKGENAARLGKTINNLGLLYFYMDDHDEALRQFFRALPLQPDPMDRATLLSNIGIIHRKEGRLDSAMIYFHQALALFIQLKNARGAGTCYNNIGLVHFDRKEYEDAVFYFRRAGDHLRKAQVTNWYANSLNNLGMALTQQRLYRMAEDTLRKGLRLVRELQNLKMETEVSQRLYQLFEAQNRSDSAFVWLKHYMFVKDSLMQNQQKEEIATIQTKYDEEQKVIKLEKNLAEEREKRWAWTTGVLVLSIITSVGGYFFWKWSRASRRNESQHAQVLTTLRNNEEAQQAREALLNEELAFRSRELAGQTIHLLQKNDLLRRIAERLREGIGDNPKDEQRFRPILRLVENNINDDERWEEFKQRFEGVHTGFFQRLLEIQPKLTAHDLRYCAYLRMNLTSKEIASLLNTSLRGVETHRYRLRRKLNLETDSDLPAWIIKV
ncbi:MAG: tetratricopeptide repeat protein [Saprospiraceae bacterium]|nr:tetratricopeptide repeat protein [Saprospiraceae bacterium]